MTREMQANWSMLYVKYAVCLGVVLELYRRDIRERRSEVFKKLRVN